MGAGTAARHRERDGQQKTRKPTCADLRVELQVIRQQYASAADYTLVLRES